jgi:hypothetical protein
MEQAFEVRDVQDWWGKPVVIGHFDETLVKLPMSLTAVSQPHNWSHVRDHTSLEFGAFAILPTGPPDAVVHLQQ